MKRGDIVVVSAPGDYGKPRPALVIQSDLFLNVPSVTVLLITSELVDAPLIRIAVTPSTESGLREPSHIMVDKAFTIPRKKISTVCGYLDDQTMLAVNRALAVFLGFA
ncbi:MAG TPA: type II toxin-antitoxin system PemK/MazF family toxin [Bryobacteraceae bacterium]|nr:type II toxin-antitoxin system PemK/MazF family toxin [Bryobacteraceae bacterium]